MILWPHRGVWKTKKQQNTIQALDNAFNFEYRHIEFDIWLLNNKLLLKHDKPTEKELQNNSLPLLKEFVKRYGNKLKYWMDFKNLTLENIDEFLPIYKKVIDNSKIDYKAIYFTPFETNWNVSIKLHKKIQNYMKGINSMIMMNFENFEKEKIYDYYKILQENNITNFSVEHKIVNKKFVDTFQGINLFVWVVNNIKEYERLANLGVKNICTNNITYKDLQT
ncbi:hypothetical protein ACFL0U_00025 [Pseudomonadota bacterium]